MQGFIIYRSYSYVVLRSQNIVYLAYYSVCQPECIRTTIIKYPTFSCRLGRLWLLLSENAARSTYQFSNRRSLMLPFWNCILRSEVKKFVRPGIFSDRFNWLTVWVLSCSNCWMHFYRQLDSSARTYIPCTHPFGMD